ncbi:hypothetical protein FR483_n226L [Paramecium bursaria Chlorella virus FR483]|uniref:Uncharacterized protein n226L n=1 Tax=Paramecium bursaria Chlorella virus FR483 TaxID=399781 RepID=A7J6T0_PBCVF|nr:hypothetical protein FR483_n226L [Paramecium bursaria Chlorella virus FR483]ABT15511.1 hypothetical protein FR483_n226L [Paramecium bursaria Chlorella virus FR483]
MYECCLTLGSLGLYLLSQPINNHQTKQKPNKTQWAPASLQFMMAMSVSSRQLELLSKSLTGKSPMCLLTMILSRGLAAVAILRCGWPLKNLLG